MTTCKQVQDDLQQHLSSLSFTDLRTYAQATYAIDIAGLDRKDIEAECIAIELTNFVR
jgi:hypothetical protein